MEGPWSAPYLLLGLVQSTGNELWMSNRTPVPFNFLLHSSLVTGILSRSYYKQLCDSYMDFSRTNNKFLGYIWEYILKLKGI